MIDRWYYTHGGHTRGPVTAAQLRQLAVAGQLGPNDLIWPERRQQSEAVPAQAAIDFASVGGTGVSPVGGTGVSPVQQPLANKPDWLDDIRAAASEKKPVPPVRPDWLDDIRAAAASQLKPAAPDPSEWLEDVRLEFDAEERVNEILEELEEVPHSQAMTEFIPEPSATCRLVVGSATTRGRVRDHNEDSLLVQQLTWSNREERHDVALVVVADGMGGHAAGERASGLVVRALSGVLTPLLTAALNDSSAAAAPNLGEALENGLREANRLVRQTAQENAACKGMGSTAAALLIWDGRVCIRLVGDCRVYHWHGGKLTQVTRDQTLVARMVELGQLTPQEAANHPRRNEVAQAIGKYALIEPGRYELPLSRGDWLVASSDGLQAHVSDRTLGETIAKAGPSAAELANRLIDLANQGGGSDNCTVAAVRCG